MLRPLTSSAAAAAAALRRPGLRRLSQFETQLLLDPSTALNRDRRTKIVATLGPSSLPKLPELLAAGINVARINCAHGDAEQYARMVEAVRAAERGARARSAASWASALSFGGGGAGSPAASSSRPNLVGSQGDVVAVAFDIKGPEIRIGKLSDAAVAAAAASRPPSSSPSPPPRELPLSRGERFVLTTDPARRDAGGDKGGIYISYAALPRRATPGQIICIDDGNVELRVVEADGDRGTLVVESLTSAPLGERKNVNVLGMVVDLPAVTDKDVRDIATAKALGADILFASFVQSAAAVREIRRLSGPDIRIVSKIESQEGIDKYDEILSASDGIMVARGDLGVQIAAERVFLAQKMMIAKANLKGKPVITATQMLESMVRSPKPTRAEIVDVASAVLDGTDAVMLSGETAKGAYPLEAVSVMARACLAAEAAFPTRAFFTALADHPSTPVSVEDDEALLYHETVQARNWLEATAGMGHEGGAALSDVRAQPSFMTVADVETLGSAAVHAAFETNAAAIVVLTVSGRTASLVAKYRPSCPVLCLVADAAVARQLMLRRGVHALLLPPEALNASGPALRALALRLVKDWGIAGAGQRVVMVHGQGVGGGDGGEGSDGVGVSLAQVR
jgi:pyruvate kinase